jgi:predicted transcriptional regulator
MAKPELPPLSEAQLEIINIIWDQGTATVGQIWKTLAKHRSLSRNTICTMVTRLEEKGWLRHRVIGGTFLYSATHPRKKVLSRMVHRLVDVAFQGSAEGLVLTLLEGGRLSAEEVQRIKVILEKAEIEKREAEQ